MSRSEPQNLVCPSDELAAYIDGELAPAEELRLEMHLAACENCTLELNYQKEFLCGLDNELKAAREIELPADFAKTVVANAESTVAGLRRPSERFNALFICAGLALFVLFALGTDAAKVLDLVYAAIDQVMAIGLFFGHLIYSLFVGVAIVLRTLAVQVRSDLVFALVFAIVAAISFTYVSRRLLRMLRI